MLPPKHYVLLCVACALVYLVGWHIPLMEIDAAQYANISREMLKTGHYLEIYDRGRDYLDKPPLLFWLSSLSMRCFGVSDATYRLPSYLFALLALFSTFKLARLFYEKDVALLSAVVLGSCQALFLITHDVRTDTMLMGWVTFTLWQLAAWYGNRSWKHLLLASVGIAGGMLTKGPLGLMVPVLCFLPHFLLRREWKPFFRWEYLVMLVIVGVLLLPMCIGLYEQYDLHPGKIIDGQEVRSGLRFFFWTQSFGRITGESHWHENGSFGFLFQNMLWSFLPWIVFFVTGLLYDIRDIVRKRFRLGASGEWITTGGFILTYCALGKSNYQLPHYIFVAFPLASIIAAKSFHRIYMGGSPESRNQTGASRLRKPLFVGHVALFCLLWVALLTLMFWPFDTIPRWLGVCAALAAAGWVILLLRYKGARLLVLSVAAIAGINLFLDLGVYPALLQYQTSSVVSKYLRQERIDPATVYPYRIDEERSLDFYTDHLYRHVQDPLQVPAGQYIMTDKPGLDSLRGYPFQLVFTGETFHVSTLDFPFLNPATRSSELKPIYILRKQ